MSLKMTGPSKWRFLEIQNIFSRITDFGNFYSYTASLDTNKDFPHWNKSENKFSAEIFHDISSNFQFIEKREQSVILLF